MTNNKTAIVTGASSGIGKATAELLHHEGYTVFAGARRVEKMQSLADKGIFVHKLDVSDPASNQAFLAFVKDHATRIDVLVNSAGYSEQGALEDVSPEAAKRQFDVNVFGLMNITQLVLPTMRAQHAGKILNVSSVGGQIYAPLGGWYYASKHALEALSDTLRLEVKPFGIDVIIIEPSGTKTEWASVATKTLLDQTPATSAYRQQVENYANNAGFENFTDTPEMLAALMLRAINANQPKTRYQPERSAKLLVIAARKLSYRQFYRLMLKQSAAMQAKK